MRLPSFARALAAPTLLAALAACGDGGSEPVRPALIVRQSAAQQTTFVNSNVAAAPSVKVTSAAGAPMAGIRVDFAVSTGNGRVGAAADTTDAQGVATAGSWTLGTAAGFNTVRATTPSIADSVATFEATGMPGAATVMQKPAGDNQTGTRGAALPVAPQVRLLDQFGNVVLSAPVTFAVTQGGGSVVTTTTITNASGVASSGTWTLGSASSAQAMRATSGTLTADFAATALDAVASLVIVEGDDQLAQAGSSLPVPPRVRALNAAGSPVGGAPIAFTIVQGGGALSSATVTANAAGEATIGWTLGGTDGIHQVRASVGAVNVTLRARVFPVSNFDIGLRFLTTATPRQQSAFIRAVDRWRQFVSGDLADVQVTTNANDCGAGTPALSEIVDDLLIFVRIDSIDGPGRVLGSAGPCFIRNSNSLTIVGTMTFDIADLATLESSGQLDDVILHEMGHVMGIGTLWTRPTINLLTGAGTADPFFTGAGARTEFANNGGATYPGTPVPVENTGGAGTRDGHWRESILNRELMTGFISRAGLTNPLSAITAASLRDMGYTVSTVASDPYAVGSTAIMANGASPDARPGRQLIEAETPHGIKVWDPVTRTGIPVHLWQAFPGQR